MNSSAAFFEERIFTVGNAIYTNEMTLVTSLFFETHKIY